MGHRPGRGCPIAALLGITIVGPAATGAAFQVLYNALRARAAALGVIG